MSSQKQSTSAAPATPTSSESKGSPQAASGAKGAIRTICTLERFAHIVRESTSWDEVQTKSGLSPSSVVNKAAKLRKVLKRHNQSMPEWTKGGRRTDDTTILAAITGCPKGTTDTLPVNPGTKS